MTNILSIPGVKVSQKDYHQIIIRGNGLEKFNNTIEEKTSIKPPSKNLEIKYDLNYLFAKNSFDQWSLILTEKKEHHQNHTIWALDLQRVCNADVTRWAPHQKPENIKENQ